ncbi:MAG: anthranilate synthase component I [Nitrosopumilales archaeon]|jgi:anthranilate synthase component 1|nr:MAG: anthranilate synthase component I [Nitrosopumilales archaeon]
MLKDFISGSQDFRFSKKKINTDKNPFEIFKQIYTNYENVFILESLTGPKELSEFSVIGFDPEFTVKCDKGKFQIYRKGKIISERKVKDPLAELRRILPIVNDKKLRYIGGAVGYVSYDAIRFWEQLPSKRANNMFPLMEFGIYTDGLIHDRKDKATYYFHIGKKSRLVELEKLLNSKSKYLDNSFYFSRPISETSKSHFVSKVKKAKDYVYEGEVFQVVISRKFVFEVHGDPIILYENLRKLNPSPYMYFFKRKKRFIIGSSPEMLLRVINDKIETFPIAGTRPITNKESENRRLAKELLRDKKELAEHTMLVDLARNDLGRVCKFGSVQPKELMIVKRFSHVQHIVSHITGDLYSKYDCFDAFRSLFPAGTVSGAPKVRAMEVISELEESSRGPYAGALGYFSFNRCCDFAIIIRSLFINGNNAFIQAGAGIVMDSIPKNEYLETEQKAGALFSAMKATRKQTK